jgi:hypothetical protein
LSEHPLSKCPSKNTQNTELDEMFFPQKNIPYSFATIGRVSIGEQAGNRPFSI